MAEHAEPVPARRRGRPRLIDRDRIVRVASGIPIEQLTMQAVAGELGVDRKALNYHVTDRDGLLRLVAAHAFQTNLAAMAPQDATDWHGLSWQNAVRRIAAAIGSGLAATGALASYIRFDAVEDMATLAPIEAFLDKMTSVGFAEETAGRTLALLSSIAIGLARDDAMRRESGVHPQDRALQEALADDSTPFPHLRMTAALDSFGQDQFDFDLQILIAGLERTLTERTD
ncbi:TetR/AcrR family transcriptional regulator C-terminal domain-containing protein [Jatrophihabitans endophyticus]|uniref:TetR/AcrR family transcriptional regulator C-terminal domain-containing protein n=1 Tax=Jatrophihabitans endophyticus TaxID=1206085 RepID=UPI0019F2821A|nr:TetR/AcrR family transcriptional regulator C-terminal domain-containing protein [Jatrophihabitans endophyticus]MBE7187599.1 TetR/AcrR family transcriptional regulator C-terminal domain-containing protein [Jatrophihabitans endophyticus]